MAAWRTWGVGLLLLAAHVAHAQTYPLAETVQPNDCLQVRLDMKLNGEMRVVRDGKPAPLPLTAEATHEFTERVLKVGANGLAAKNARAYTKAAATITVGRDRSERTLRPERQLVVAQRHNDQPLLYSPAGPLTREELELTAEHFDTLALTGLLAGKAVAVGDTWKPGHAVVQALCHFEGLTEHNLACKLAGVKGQTAQVAVSGTANGIDLGALVKLTIEATAEFDLNSKRLTRLEWKQKDEREQGPANPATTVEMTATVTRAAVPQPDALADVKLVNVPDDFQPPPGLTGLVYADPKGRFDLVCAREWQIVGNVNDHLVMRLMDRGDFVAQVTITPWTPAEKGKHLTADEFRQAMNETPGWEPGMELQAGEVPTEGGRWLYRLSTLGKMEGVDVLQNFYLLASPEGEQIVLAFTMTPKAAERLGTRDLALAGSLEFRSAARK